MRFKLSTMLVIFAMVAAALAMFREHSWFGLALFLPHGLAIGSSWMLLRQSRWRTVSAMLIVYGAAWVASATLGVRAAENRRIRLLQETVDISQLERVDERWSASHGWPPPEGKWWYVDNGTSSCPFVVRIEWGYRHGEGYGGEAYYLWCCSEPIWVWGKPIWHVGSRDMGWYGR